MADINNFSVAAAKYLDANSNVHNIMDYVGAMTTIDSRRHYLHEGKAFNMDAYDSIAAGNVFTFWGKNTGTKKIHLDEIYFNPGTFLIEFIKDGVFTLSDNPYTLIADEEPESPTYNLAPAFNMNKMSENEPTFKIYVQPAGLVRTAGTIFAREYNQSASSLESQWVIGPGQDFVAQFKNVGASSLQYFLRLIWYEVT